MSEKTSSAVNAQSAKSGTPPARDGGRAVAAGLRSPREQVLSLQRTVGNQTVQRLLDSGRIQAKLQIGRPDDPYEQEADSIAEQVMRMPEPAVRKKPACTACSETKKELQGAILPKRTSPEASAPAEASAGVQSSIESMNGGGEPLPAATRSYFEPRFGQDFSSVKVHTGPDAAEASRAIQARAFTYGNNIAFSTGEYAPESGKGRELLAHELTHVVQQKGRIVTTPDVQRYCPDAGPCEEEIPDAGVTQDIPDAGGSDAVISDADLPSGGVPADTQPIAPKKEFDPCAVNVPGLNNRELLQMFQRAESYIDGLVKAKRRGEDQFYDYGNLHRRVQKERAARAHAGHVWLNAKVSDVPSVLYRLETGQIGNFINVNPADTQAAALNASVGNAIVVTPGQFQDLLQRENIPTVDPEEFFAQQDPNNPQPLQLHVPERPQPVAPSAIFDPGDPFGLNPLGLPANAVFPFGPQAAGVVGWPSPQTMHVWNPFARPVVTAGPFGFAAEQVGGFRVDWRGDIGETRFTAQDMETLRALQDLNLIQQNMPFYDVYDPRTGEPISIKTQLPDVPGGPASLESAQAAWQDLFRVHASTSAEFQRRVDALDLLRANIDPTMTMDQMFLMTRFAVNPENVSAAQDSLENAIRRGQADYEPLLSAMLRKQSISVQLKNKSVQIYTDFTSLHADFKVGRMAKTRYRDAVAQLAQRARAQVISNASQAEAHLRPLLDYRQQYDFTAASDFASIPDTPAGRRQARVLQELYFRRIAVPELMQLQTGSMTPILGKSAATGGALGFGTSVLIQLPHTIEHWQDDPYAGRRYMTNVALNTLGGAGQATADQALRMYISQQGLDWAAARALAGRSVAPVSLLTPTARFAGSTALGGIASGGITIAGMYIDERYFGADYTTIDYTAKGTRAFVSGSVAAGVGALASAGTAAYLGAGGSGGACTVVLPGVGTVACGLVGGAVGFLVGLGAYYIFDYSFGGAIEEKTREVMGEAGCTG